MVNRLAAHEIPDSPPLSGPPPLAGEEFIVALLGSWRTLRRSEGDEGGFGSLSAYARRLRRSPSSNFA